MPKLISRFKKYRVMDIHDCILPIEVYAVDLIDAANRAAEIWAEGIPYDSLGREIICYAIQVEDLEWLESREPLRCPKGISYCQGVVSSIWNSGLGILSWGFTEVSDYRGYKAEVSRIIKEKKYGIK